MDNIRPTDHIYPGTKIPKSFEITVGNQKILGLPKQLLNIW